MFYGNSSNNGYGHGFGGAIYSVGSNISNSVFVLNTAESNGEGGAILAKSNTQISNCNFIDNKGVYNGNSIGGDCLVLNSTFHSSNSSGYGLISNYYNGSITLNNSNIYSEENYIFYNRNSTSIDLQNIISKSWDLMRYRKSKFEVITWPAFYSASGLTPNFMNNYFLMYFTIYPRTQACRV